MKNKEGIGLIEIVISASIVGGALFALLVVAQNSLSLLEDNTQQAQAAYLAEEGLEVMRYLRDQSWNNIGALMNNQDYYLQFTEGAPASWAVTAVAQPAVFGAFTRTIRVFDANRSPTDDIVSAGGVADNKTKRVQVTITWGGPRGPKNFVLETYIAAIF